MSDEPPETSPAPRRLRTGRADPADRDPAPRRKRGGQSGNTNALKHGLYSQALPARAQQALWAARQLQPTDLTEEIATLRARLAALGPSQLKALTTGLALLARLAATHYRMTPGRSEELAAAVQQAVRELGLTFLWPEDEA